MPAPDYLMLENQMVNLAHIVRAEYNPPYAGGEELEPGEVSKPHAAQLSLTLTSLHIESDLAYDGDVEGTASASDVVLVSGKEAERAWGFLHLMKKFSERARNIEPEQ